MVVVVDVFNIVVVVVAVFIFVDPLKSSSGQ